MNGPYFIVVEGLDGSGKTTQIDHLRHYLQAQGEACYLTAQPSELPTGRFIRRILQQEFTVDDRTLAALYAADRIEHIYHPQEGILSKLAQGYHVICSRYYFSSLAYQGAFVDPEWVAGLNGLAKRTLPADLTVFLDLTPEKSMQRINARAEPAELFESLPKLTEVRDAFRNAFVRYGGMERIVTVDASQSERAVAEDIIAAVVALDLDASAE